MPFLANRHSPFAKSLVEGVVIRSRPAPAGARVNPRRAGVCLGENIGLLQPTWGIAHSWARDSIEQRRYCLSRDRAVDTRIYITDGRGGGRLSAPSRRFLADSEKKMARDATKLCITFY